MNTLSRLSVFAAVFVVAAAVGLAWMIVRSPYVTGVGVTRDQPVPFSHRHHVGDIGLDCRYCHTSVEEAGFAGIPPTATCMNCHSQLFADSAMLEPVRASFATNQSLLWTRVHDVPDFVYFDHSIHVHKGVACSTCHGDVGKMPLMFRTQTLHMEWCLECHRNPEEYLREHQPGGLAHAEGSFARLRMELAGGEWRTAAGDEAAAAAAGDDTDPKLSKALSSRRLDEQIAGHSGISQTAFSDLKSRTSCYTCHR